MTSTNGVMVCDKCKGSGKCPTCRKSKNKKCGNCGGSGEIALMEWDGPIT